MYTDKERAEIHQEVRAREHALFGHLLTPGLFLQAARQCGLRVVASPLNLINLVWLALSAARNPQESFASLLGLPFKALLDHQAFASKALARRIERANLSRQNNGSSKSKKPAHHPKADPVESVSPVAFSLARQAMPTEFWVALFCLLGQRFNELYADVIRWGRYRLLAVDGTRISLPDYPALREHFGTAKNSHGAHNAQARMVLAQFPLARVPYAYSLGPVKVGEPTMARQLLRGLSPLDLVLLDAAFLCYGLLCQVHQQRAFFCLRLRKGLNLRTIKELGGADDVLVEWQPKDSRGKWRREGLPKSMTLRLLTYRAEGFRPLRLLTNVLSEQEVAYEEFWGLSVSEQGEVLGKGLYNWRWEIEVTYAELKGKQGLDGGLRSRTAEGVEYEVAGQVLLYLLARWLMAEAAEQAGVSPLRLSFREALREVEAMTEPARLAGEGWLSGVLLPRLRGRLASHRVAERPGRQYPRQKAQRRAAKRASQARLARRRQAEPAAKNKPRAASKARPRPWFGEGWDLSGRLTPATPPPQA
jgi:Transposase DDE domain